MNELIPINILLADRTYRIKVEVADEETVRKKVKFINDKLMAFKQEFSGKDMQDYIAMVLIWYATQPAADVSSLLIDGEVSEGISRLDALLQKGLTAFHPPV